MASVEALLDPGSLVGFEALCGALLGQDNDARRSGEGALEACKAHPDALVAQLARCLRTSANPACRDLSAVLLRKVITGDDTSLWPKLQPTTQAALKQELLQSLQDEQGKSTTKKVCDTICELAAGIFETPPGWPELLPFMFQCVQGGSDRLKESALLIFAQLAMYLAEQLLPHVPTLHQVLHGCLQGGIDLSVRVAALRATCSFVQGLEEDRARLAFQDLLPAMLDTLASSLNVDEATAQEALRIFVELAETDARFVRKHLADVANAMLVVAESQVLEDGTRQLAAEFLVTLVEARDRAPGMMRKLPNFMARLFNCLTHYLLDIEDDPQWHAAEEEQHESAGEGERYEVGQECLDRVAIAAGGKTVVPVISPIVSQLLNDADWKKRHAALIILSQVAEGCAKVMQKQPGQAVAPCLALVGDPHPRVRWAAINGIGQMCTDLGPDLQDSEVNTLLPALIAAMDDFQNPRVQAHSTAAVINFSEGCPPEKMAPYMDAIVSKLLGLLNSGKRVVMEGACTALASVADCAQDAFIKYYDTVMPYLKNILTNATDTTHRMLRAKAMECVSLVGMAVGVERFRDDARAVMQMLVAMQQNGFEDDDPTGSYSMRAFTRICKCLGKEFLPYLPTVMPPLLHAASVKEDVVIKALDDDDDDDDDDDLETIEFNDKRIAIRTSVLDEKATACNLICCYVEELKEGFLPYLEQVLEIMVPLLKFFFHDEVRRAAVQCMPDMMRAAKASVEAGQRDQAWLKGMNDRIIPSLTQALHREPDVELQAAMLEALSELASESDGLMDQAQVAAVVEEVKGALNRSSKRRKERAERAKTEDFAEEDAELLEEENEVDDELFDQVAECIGAFLKVYHSNFLPFVDTLVPLVLPYLQPGRSAEERRVAICLFDDVVEYASENGAALRYYDTFFGPMIQACLDQDHQVRQAAVYGVGQCATHGGERFRAQIGEACQALATVIQSPVAFEEEAAAATENAVSALGKVYEHHRDALGANADQVVGLWLSVLPLKGEDEVEAQTVHEQLCRLCEKGDQFLMRQNSLAKVLTVFSGCLSSRSKPQLVTDEVAQRIKQLLLSMQSSLPGEVLGAVWGALGQEHQQALTAALSS